MFFKRFLAALFLVAIAAPSLFACSLPAEPSAAIVPINAAANGMKLVVDGNTFFYLVPQGASTQFKVVWDPAAHNTGGNLQKDKYDWCTKAGLSFEDGTDSPNGYGYFPIQAMADFFTIQGNSGSIQEAFARETGMSTGDTFLPSIGGAYMLLSGIVKAGQEGKVTTLGGASSEYPDAGVCNLVSMTNTIVNSAIDINFPTVGWMIHEVPISTADTPQMLQVYRKGDRAVVISGEGLLIESLEMALTELTPQDFKAFIRTGNPADNIEVKSTPSLVWSANGSNGTPGPDFSITFNTPSFNGTLNESRIQLKVWSPGAGYELSNMFWAWKEEGYKKSSRRVITQPEVRNASGVVVIPEKSEMREVWISDGSRKCSEEILLKLVKPAAEAGSTDFVVYDTKSPIAADFKIASADKLFKPTGPTTFNFTLKVLDTNPFFDKAFATSIENVSLIQKVDNLDLQIFYTYPVYQYSAVSAQSINELKTANAGIADLDNTAGEASFKSFKHETKWAWKKAEVSNLSIGNSSQLAGSTGKKAGSLTDVSGKLTIKQPLPWHECNEGTGKSMPEPVFKVIAISKDSAGNAIDQHATVSTTVGDSKIADTAKPDAGSVVFAFNPADGAKIPPGDLPDQVNGGIDKSRWSNVELLKAEDKTGPEIQVVVFDTRTNRCHMFGTKQNVAAGFSDFGVLGLKEDYSTGDVPYLGKETEISDAHKFTDMADINSLFDQYLKGPDAVSTVTDDSSKGFVCQQNNRLVFYIRAVDNINGYRIDKTYGVQSLSYKLTDKAGVVKDASISAAAMLDPIEYVFRFENVDTHGNISPEYSLVVNATDYSGNPREFKLAIAVMGRKLEIRTLEERRQRLN